MRILLATIVLLSPIDALALSDQEYLERITEVARERDPEQRLDLVTELLDDSNAYERFTVLATAAKTAFEAKKFVLAEKYAKELLALASRYPEDWNHGNAIHDGNMVLGRLAVSDGNIESGEQYLLKAGRTPGSPQLNTFGPNMSLANDLLEHGRKKAVINYFELCRRFWEMERGRLDSWIASIRGGGRPYFGANQHH